MAFGYLADIRLPPDIERGAVGGPRFNTTVLSLSSGSEKRNSNWIDTRGEWDVGYGILVKYNQCPLVSAIQSDVAALSSFFYVAKGRANSFRFKDWSDYEIGRQQGIDTTAIPTFATADGVESVYQLYKEYRVETQAGGTYFTHQREITKPRNDSTFELYRNGVLDATTPTFNAGLEDVTPTSNQIIVNLETGRVAYGSNVLPSDGDVLGVRCDFDCHVRFDTDKLDLNMEMFNSGSWPNVPVVELVDAGDIQVAS